MFLRTLVAHAQDTKRKMFEHPEQVPWHKVSAVLDALFRQNTGRGLRPEHLDYLAKIAFRESLPLTLSFP